LSDHKMVFGASQKSTAVFHAAQRHSLRVRVLKTALPVSALAIAAIFSWFTFLAAPAATVKVELDASEKDQQVMTSPQVSGYTSDNRPYSMIASRAVQDVKQSGVIMLEGIKAQFPVGDKDNADIDASSGVYDSVNGHIKFDKDFVVRTSNGLEAKLSSANVNVTSGEMSTDKPVDIRTDNAHIRADKMQIQDNGKVMVFENKVQLTIEPVKEAAANTGKKGS
jgi:lipopolysaccharide export system protein LptC